MPPWPMPFYFPPAPRLNTAREIVMAFGTYGSVALAVLMALNVGIAVWGIDLVWPHLDKHIYLFVITPFIVNFAELGGSAFFAYYIVLVAAIASSFAWLIYKSLPALKDELQVRQPQGGHSPLYITATMLFAVLTFNIAYYFIIQAFGVSTTTPSFETRELWQLIYGFAHASVWEEVASRVLLIGVPLLLIDLLLRMKDPGRGMRRLSNYVLGGGFAIGRKEAFLMVFSSLMFGAAHMFSWDLFKILPAAAAGLAFAYLYLKLGLYASIMFHFATDFLTVPLQVWPDYLLVTAAVGLMLLVWLAIGAPYMLLYFSKGAGWLLGRRIWPDVPREGPGPSHVPSPLYAVPAAMYYPAPNVPPAFYAGGPAVRFEDPQGYVCKNCGNREAAYTEGRLVCTRCGARR